MPLYATNIWDTPGASTLFEINFAGGYLSPSHVKVVKEDKITRAKEAVPFRLLNPYTVELLAPVPGYNLWVYRETPVNAPLADFTDGAFITEANLDVATQQAVFAVAELYDKVALGLVGQAFSGYSDEETVVATDGQTTFPAPYHTGADHVTVFVNRLRVHPSDVSDAGTHAVTLPPQRAGVSVTVEVLRLTPLIDGGAGGGGGGGPAPANSTTAANVGVGLGLFRDKAGDTLNFKTLVAGPNVTLTPAGDTVTIEATAAPAPPPPPGAKAPVSTSLAGFTMNSLTPNGRVEFADTSPGGWNTIPGSQVVDFEVVVNGYFAANPNGHVAIVGRCDVPALTSVVSGQGFVFGKVTGDAGNSADYFPTSLIETWRAPNNLPHRWLYPNTDGGPGNLMADGGRYRFTLFTTLHDDGTRTIRYRRLKWNATWLAWDDEIDTGDVLDNNTTADLTKAGLAFGHVGSSNLTSWSLVFSNIKVTWCAPVTSADARPYLPRAGGKITGDIWMGSSRFYVHSSSTPASWTRFVDRTAGADTKLLVTPNSTSGTAAVLLANSANANPGYLSIGAYPGYASIHTGVEAGGTRPAELRFSYDGLAANSLTAKPSGVYAPGALLPLGKDPYIMAAAINLGGQQATSFTNNSALDFEELCTVNNIRNYLMTGGYSQLQASTIEGLLRPAFAYISTLAASARNKGCA